MAMASGDALLIAFLVVASIIAGFLKCRCGPREQQAPRESRRQRIARMLAALAARDEEAVQVLDPLPFFPYAAQGGRASSEAADCAICLEPLRQSQLCSEVPSCRHVFHRDCLGEWARSSGSCSLCRAKIVPGSDGGAAVGDDMV